MKFFVILCITVTLIDSSGRYLPRYPKCDCDLHVKGSALAYANNLCTASINCTGKTVKVISEVSRMNRNNKTEKYTHQTVIDNVPFMMEKASIRCLMYEGTWTFNSGGLISIDVHPVNEIIC